MMKEGPPGERHEKLGLRIGRKGLLEWQHMWDPYQTKWYSAEVVRQRYLQLTEEETAIVRGILDGIPDWFPTNVVAGPREDAVEWQWYEDKPLKDTSTKVVYDLLNYRVEWVDRLNSRWKRDDSIACWSKRCFKVWKGTPFNKYNSWSWCLLSGAIKTGDKLRSWEDISALCAWCGRAKETMVHLFWGCPSTHTFWGEINLRLKLDFGHSKISAHMLLIGRLRNHSSDYGFAWPLTRAVTTDEIWKERNKVKFEKSRIGLDKDMARGSLFKVAWLLRRWPGKKKELAIQIAQRLFEALLDNG